jgi:hypothetical protein
LVDSYRSSLGLYGGSNLFSNGDEQAAGSISGGSVVQGQLYPNSPAGLTPFPTPAAYTDLGDLQIAANQVYTLQTGDYLVGTLNMASGASLRPQGGRVRLWFSSLAFSGHVDIGANIPSDLWLFSRASAANAVVMGSATLHGVIFGPNIPVTCNGSSEVFGALVGSSVAIAGSAQLHYDEDLGLGCRNGGLARAGEGKRGDSMNLPLGKSLVALPNPSRERFLALFKLDSPCRSRLLLTNLAGEIVGSKDLGELSTGEHKSEFSDQGLTSGLYFLFLQCDEGHGWNTTARFKVAIVR